MRDVGVTLTVTDPSYRGRVLAVHVQLTDRDAAQLAAVYRALRYPDSCITIAPAPYRVAA
jgi:putative lipoic acid-binding regulatory protein